MKKRYHVLAMILIAAASFFAGSWATYQGGRSKATVERKILHYVDPMNPGFTSDKPGIAPCGMPLEPVYADQGGAGAGRDDLRASMYSGRVRITPEKQQLIGVKLGTVERVAWTHTLRVLGRVVPDETLTYRINAAVNGWIEDAPGATTGSLVKENEILATFYSLEYRNLVQNYFNLINIVKEGSPGEKAVSQASRYSTGQLKQLREAAGAIGQAGESSQIDFYRRNLYNVGMSPYQVAEMERTRKIPEVIEIRAPIQGFVLYRNVSPGLRFDRGAEFFRIADLSRVWILADIFETEAAFFKPGTRTKMELPYQKKTLYAKVSSVLPLFDPATRTLKVRLEADNPGYVMRPDMFVNVELPVTGAPTIIVPTEAVLDSGLKKTVFVDKGNGFFEPRQVETGRSLGERVEIARGLMPGEKIVVSGNFLIDSEARMQQAASGPVGKIGRDPVCRMNIDEDRAKAEGNVHQHQGKSYFFCSPECRNEFAKDPTRHLKAASVPAAMPMDGSQDAAPKHTSHGPAPGPTARGAKAVTETHGGMTMPGAQTPTVMPGMPATSPITESKTGRTAAPATGPQSPTHPEQGWDPMSMPQGHRTMSGPQADGMAAPTTPGMGPQSTAVPGSGDAPMPGPRGGPMPGSAGASSPSAVGPGTGPQGPSFQGPLPGPGGMSIPPGPAAAPLPGGHKEGSAPQVPATRTPAINQRSQRYRLPEPVPMTGAQSPAESSMTSGGEHAHD